VARDGPALAFALGGLSKSCALPQLKLAWMAVTGPEPERNEALGRLEVIADTYLSVSTPVQIAAPDLLARREELQAPVRERLRANLDTLRSRLSPASPASLLDPEGGWYAVLRVPATMPEEERVSRLLEQRDVLVHPGYFFDFPREAFLVVSLLPSLVDFEEGIDRVLADLVL
jgi:aspartate/methionine/tyrosine aminotransferase